MLSINIIGAGHVGQTLARALHYGHYFKIQGVFNRTHARAQQSVAFIGSGIPCANLLDLPPADIQMISVTDLEIVPVAQALAKLPNIRTAKIAFHCSGAVASTALSPLAVHGISLGSLHPIMTFPTPLSSDNLRGVFATFEGEELVHSILHPVFTALGMTILRISTEKKGTCHAAIVIACNYLVSLIDIACQLYTEAGLSESEAFAIMQPVLEKTLHHVFSLGTQQALTGPIARGDINTIKIHLEALKNMPDLKCLYTQLGLHTIKLSEKKNDVDKMALDKIKDLLLF